MTACGQTGRRLVVFRVLMPRLDLVLLVDEIVGRGHPGLYIIGYGEFQAGQIHPHQLSDVDGLNVCSSWRLHQV